MRLKLTERLVASIELPQGKSQLLVRDDLITGFGVVVGRRARTFFAETRVGRTQKRVKIGIWGNVREDGHTWSVTRARSRARELLGTMASGVDPTAETRRRRNGPTLRDGLQRHVRNMRLKKCSERSIHTIETELTRLAGDWMDRPIVELTGQEIEELCDEVREGTAVRAGSVNQKGQALTNRLVAHVSAVWNTLDKLHDLPGKNPATRITRGKLDPRSERIPDDGFASWYETVKTLSPVRRDLQLFTLFTALRSESVRTLEWDAADAKRELLHVRKAKGNKPYTVPLSSPCLAILERRRKENAREFRLYGGDGGYVFPSLTRAKPYRVIPVREPKEVRVVDGERVRLLPGLHALRRTHNSVGIEAGVLREHREALLNHDNNGVNVEHYGRPQNWEHLAGCQETIAHAILKRMKVTSV